MANAQMPDEFYNLVLLKVIWFMWDVWSSLSASVICFRLLHMSNSWPHRFCQSLSQRYSLPRTRSTTEQPLTCSPGCRQWFKMSSFSQPASCRASARMGIRSNAFSS